MPNEITFLARGAAAVALLFASAARAQEVSIFASPVESRATNALEIKLGLGSAQGYGKAESAGPDLGTFGAGAELAIGWRINRRWMVGAYNSSALYPGQVGAGAMTLGVAAGLQATRHFGSGFGPWVGLGAGWHGYWISHDGARSAYSGVDLARLQVGWEVPVSPTFSLEPVVGVTLATFGTQRASRGAAADDRSGSLSVFVLAGALARFDVFGSGGEPLVLAAARP
jgi:hypothetical protein